MNDIGAQATSIMETRDASMADQPVDAADNASTVKSISKDGQPPQKEQALVKEILKKIATWKKHHEDAFKKMKNDVRFASNKHGAQWNGSKTAPQEEMYVAQITFRHIQGRTGVLYAKNPRVKAQRRKRLDFKIWDGTQQHIQQAMQALDTAAKAMSGQPTVTPPPPGAPPGAQPAVGPPPPMPQPVDIAGAQAVLAEAQQVKQKRAMLDRIGKTAEILYQYYQGEGDPAFKKRAKAWVRRTLTTGVGWLKLDFERQNGPSDDPEKQYRPEDKDNVDNLTAQLAHLKSELAKVADDETPEGSPRLMEIEAQLKTLQEAAYIVIKEGLTFSFPKSWRVIPDDNCTQLTGLVDCWELAEEMPATPDEIREAYNIDIKNSAFTRYEGKDKNGRDRTEAMTYEHYNRRTGLMCVVCEGYPGFLVKPTAPRVAVSRFFPHYPLAFNEMECEDGEIFPPSDVELIAPMQREYNRSREALRQHRIAMQPGHVADAQAFSNEKDVRAMRDRNPHDVVMLEGLGGKKIGDVLMAIPLNNIDPNIYEVNPVFQDIQRTVGDQAANLGGTSDATATESSISENSRLSTVASNVDDLDMVLTEVARDSAHVMLTQVSQEMATKIAGEGAIWPSISGNDYAMEIYLEIVAGSSGRPNRDKDAANIERLFPLAIQTGYISPKYLAGIVVRAMDETVDEEDAILDGMPSILAINAIAKAGAPQMGGPGGGDAPTGNPATDPNNQGGAAPASAGPPVGAGGGPGPMHPAPNAAGPPLP